jgi:hypothetical protein
MLFPPFEPLLLFEYMITFKNPEAEVLDLMP